MVKRMLSDVRALLALPCGFSLVMLRPQLQSVGQVNDLSFQIPMVEWAKQQMLSGHIPFDGWFPNLSLGASQFHHYQVFPHLVSAAFALVIGSPMAVLLSTYLLWSLWPICIYWTARLFDRSRGEALAAALICPFLASMVGVVGAGGYGFEIRSYVWQGSGLWTQLWAMWFLPLAMGFSWRALNGRAKLLWPALLLAATITSHLLFGYLGLIFLVVLVAADPKELIERAKRGAVIFLAALACSAWLLVPLVSDSAYDPISQVWQHTTWLDSWGAAQVLGWLVSGQMFDSGQFPVVSLLAGLAACLTVVYWRKSPSARAFLICAVVALILFCGPTTFPFLRALPGGESIWFHRFVAGVQLCAIFLAGAGGYWLFELVRGWFGRRLSNRNSLFATGAFAALLLSSPVVAQASFDQAGANRIAEQASADASVQEQSVQTLINYAQSNGPGRIFAGLRAASWASAFAVGHVPVYQVLANHGVDEVGFSGRVQSISTDPEFNFDETQVGDYRAFGVRYLLLPSWKTPPVPAHLLISQSIYFLYEVNDANAGYVSVVDSINPPVAESHVNMLDQSYPILEGQDLKDRRYHPVAFNGAPAAEPSAATAQQLAGLPPAGLVVAEKDDLSNGDVMAQVSSTRDSVVLLSVSFDPRWTVTVDGTVAAPEILAPSLMGVTVRAGTHTVEFRYVPYPWYWLWALVGLLACVGLTRPGPPARFLAKFR